jgi:hypothetical protein
MEIRALRPDDNRSAFRSDDDGLDLFFRQYAGQNPFKHHIGVTYVAIDEDRILGFATLMRSSVRNAPLQVSAAPTA